MERKITECVCEKAYQCSSQLLERVAQCLSVVTLSEGVCRCERNGLRVDAPLGQTSLQRRVQTLQARTKPASDLYLQAELCVVPVK